MVSIKKIKQLREETNISLALCKQALEKSKGNLEQAKIFLKKQGFKIILGKLSNQTKHGIIHAYIHSNKKIGVLIDLRCSTDFVAQSEKFQKLAHDLCLQIAASNPLYIRSEDIPIKVLEKEKEIYKAQAVKEKRPAKVIEMIIKGKMKKYFEEVCLLSQVFVKNPDEKVEDIIKKNIFEMKENIVVKSFIRYQI